MSTDKEQGNSKTHIFVVKSYDGMYLKQIHIPPEIINGKEYGCEWTVNIAEAVQWPDWIYADIIAQLWNVTDPNFTSVIMIEIDNETGIARELDNPEDDVYVDTYVEEQRVGKVNKVNKEDMN